MKFDAVGAVARYHALLNAFDLDGAERLFTENAVYLSPGIGALVGRDAIFAAMRRYYDKYSDQVAFDDEIKLIAPHIAPYVVHAKWRLVATSRKTGARVNRSGIETVAFDQTNLIERIEVSDLPLNNPPEAETAE